MTLHHALAAAAPSLGPILVGPAWADEPKPDTAAVEAEGSEAFKAARAALKVGPLQIPLAGQASLSLPADYAFIPAAEGARLMRAIRKKLGLGRTSPPPIPAAMPLTTELATAASAPAPESPPHNPRTGA